MRTLPVDPLQASAMIYFDIKDAAKAVVALRSLEINAAEMLDSRSLSAVQDTTGKTLRQCLRRSLHLQRMNSRGIAAAVMHCPPLIQ